MTEKVHLTTVQRDRAVGAIIGSAAGDALGAPFEFEPPVGPDTEVALTGGGFFGWVPGEWTDDTSMALCILQLLAEGRDLALAETQNLLVAAWRDWAKTAPDVGMQTRSLLSSLVHANRDEALRIGEEMHRQTGRTAGNGSLMRTGPVCLGSLGSFEATASNARAISKLTHWDDMAGDACVLWSLAIQGAILDGVMDIRFGIDFLPVDRRETWLALIEEAESNPPTVFSNNGWVVHAFQGAWSAIHLAVGSEDAIFEHPAQRFTHGLENAVRGGYDTDTVAAIAGSLLGAYFGSTAVPASWRLKLHGWPGMDERQLSRVTHSALNQPSSDDQWPNVAKFDYSTWSGRFELAQHPADPGLWMGGVGSLGNLPSEITAVVSLCRVGTEDVPERIDTRLEVFLMDKPGKENNLNAAFVFADVADAIKDLRDAGEVVYLHCVQSQSRTPSVAATYAIRHLGRSPKQALDEIRLVLPAAEPITYFRDIILGH